MNRRFFGRLLYRIGCPGFHWARIPSVQVVSDIVTISTLRETGKHTGRVWRTMATLAGRKHLVLVFMTSNTVDTFMLGVCLAVQLESLLVTRCTHFVSCIRRIYNGCRHMGLVTFFTICCGHFCTVWFVALGTERNLSMHIVAVATSQGGVLALDLFKFNDLLSMAG